VCEYDLYGIHVKKERRKSLLKTEVTYTTEIIRICKIFEYKIYRIQVLNKVKVIKAVNQI